MNSKTKNFVSGFKLGTPILVPTTISVTLSMPPVTFNIENGKMKSKPGRIVGRVLVLNEMQTVSSRI